MVDDSRRIEHVECAGRQGGLLQIRLNEQGAFDSEATCRCRAELERCTRQISADNQTITPGQIQAHLAGTATGVNDPRIARHCLVEKLREFAPPRPRAKRLQVIAWWIARKGSSVVEPAHSIGARAAGKAQMGNPFRGFKTNAATLTYEVCRQPSGARRTSKQFAKTVDHQKMA